MAGVYISYPFCAQKCTYCNFASGVFPRELEPRYLETLRTEIRNTQCAWKPETVYLGGGTPSLIDPESLAALLGEIPHEEKLVTLPLKELAEQFIFALVYRASGPISPPARQFINLLTMMAPSNI